MHYLRLPENGSKHRFCMRISPFARWKYLIRFIVSSEWTFSAIPLNVTNVHLTIIKNVLKIFTLCATCEQRQKCIQACLLEREQQNKAKQERTEIGPEPNSLHGQYECNAWAYGSSFMYFLTVIKLLLIKTLNKTVSLPHQVCLHCFIT